jgi:hypothetical protein
MDDALSLPLTVSVPCRAAPGTRARRHPVVIEADWSVRTPHDERLEQIAAALGGGVSCLPTLRAIMPAFIEWWRRARREGDHLLASPDQGRSWASTDGLHRCCPAAGFDDPRQAAAHVRDVGHVAAVTGADRRTLAGLVAGLGPTRDPPAPVPDSADPSGVLGAAWACGLHPDRVSALMHGLAAAGACPGAAGACPIGGAAPTASAQVQLILALVQTGADPGWLAASTGPTAVRPVGDPADPRLLTWLAWTCTDLDRQVPTARAEWLARGARRSDIVTLSTAGYRAEAAGAVAAAWRISVPGAAQWLAQWVAHGYRPTAEQLIGLRDIGLGFPPPPPAPAAVARTAELLGTTTLDPTVVAVALVRHGTARDTAAALRRAAPGRGRRRSTRLPADRAPVRPRA